MTITIDLAPTVETAVREQAALRGVRMEDYVRQLIEQASLSPEAEAKRYSREEFERDWDEFSAGTEHLPVLSDADLSREAMYANHD